MPSDTSIEFPCVQVLQPIGAFYIGAMAANDLLAISYADVRRIEARDIERVVGIQRPLSPQRVSELRQYVNTVDAAFPTSVILAIDSEHAEYDEKRQAMRINRDAQVAKIIDGQHRIAGLEGLSGGVFQVNVTVFVDMDLEDQAMLFATINLKQTKVSKSLMYDLYEFASSRSPQKTCHNIAKLLNQKAESPFKDKIKILGRATGKREETLTQATFVECLMPYITKDPIGDRDKMKRGQRLDRAGPQEARVLIFRNLFIDEDDARIARNVWNYFAAVASRWPTAWPGREKGNVLNRTTGFGALMRFLRDAYISLARREECVAESKFRSIFDRIRLKDKDFNSDQFKPGTSGSTTLYKRLLGESGLAQQ